MKLREILKEVDIIKIEGSDGIEINEIKYNSKEVAENDIFVAIKGTYTDGSRFIEDAIQRGASCIIHDSENTYPDVTDIVVSNSRKALAQISDRFFHSPSKDLNIIGITGTNGKTTVSYLIKSIIEASGYKAGLLGTIAYNMEDESIEAPLTTPESLEIQRFLNKARNMNAGYVVMEVSSHALKQDRTCGLRFSAGVFTNISRDHLDYHLTMDDYINSKLKLFKQIDTENGFAVINEDDPVSEKIRSITNANCIGYSLSKQSGIYPIFHNTSFDGIKLTAHTPTGNIEINSKLIGHFNIYNILSAIGVGTGLNFDKDTIKKGIEKVEGVSGRAEKIECGQKFRVIVDYSHTPDSVKNMLSAVKPLTAGKIIAVLGCGGDRDKGKRPMMGSIASEYADISVITSDNPRTEDPLEIINDIIKGIENRDDALIIPERKEAIEKALSIAQDKDTVLILGKGHENYQIIGKNKVHFDDKEIVSEFLTKII